MKKGSADKSRLASLLFGIALILFGAWIVYNTSTRASEKVVIFESTKVIVEVPETPEEQEQGLGGRESLGEDEGMLFVYETEKQRFFWMKDMKISIDIVWMNSDKEVIDITRNLSPDTYPEKFTSAAPAQYVLEVSAGYTEDNNINIGDKAVIKL